MMAIVLSSAVAELDECETCQTTTLLKVCTLCLLNQRNQGVCVDHMLCCNFVSKRNTQTTSPRLPPPCTPPLPNCTTIPPTTMASSSSSITIGILAACLALAFCLGSASAGPPSMPAACLRAATSLCQGSHTSALRCLRDKVRSGDAAVPQACSEALQLPAQPLKQQQGSVRSRTGALARLLTEGGVCAYTASPICTLSICNASGPNQCFVNCKCSSYVQAVQCNAHITSCCHHLQHVPLLGAVCAWRPPALLAQHTLPGTH